MPKFFYTVTVIALALWAIVYRIMTTKAPNNTATILGFLLIFFFALSITVSLPIYYMLHRKAPRFTQLRDLYRKALKVGIYVGFGSVLFLVLNMWSLVNVITLILFISLYIMGFLSLKKHL